MGIQEIRNIKSGEKKKKKVYRIPHTSVKRAEQKKNYLELRNSYLRIHKLCECGCGRWATEVHHKKGKIGKLLTDVRFFLAVCRVCHTKIGDEPNWAIKMGYSISRHKKTEMKKGKIVLTILAAVAISLTVLSFSEPPAVQGNYFSSSDTGKEKQYPLLLTATQWDELLKRLTVVSNVLKTSNIPSQTTTTLVDSLILPIQALILQRVGPLVRADSSLVKTAKPSQ